MDYEISCQSCYIALIRSDFREGVIKQMKLSESNREQAKFQDQMKCRNALTRKRTSLI
jgi:hypothetical protein